jgi:RecJ-like exonuclease
MATCKACDGKGNDGYHKNEICPICDGTGVVGEFVEKKTFEDKKKVKK